MNFEFKKELLPISFHNNTAFVIGLIIGRFTYSSTTKSWWVNMRNISDVVDEQASEEGCKDFIREKLWEFLNELQQAQFE